MLWQLRKGKKGQFYGLLEQLRRVGILYPGVPFASARQIRIGLDKLDGLRNGKLSHLAVYRSTALFKEA